MTYDPTGGFPDLDTIRVEIGVPATLLPDETLDKVAGSEQDNVRSAYDYGVGDLPDRMYAVFIRQIARAVAARGVPLGILAADAEYGTVRLSMRDSEVTRMGGQYRKRGFA